MAYQHAVHPILGNPRECNGYPPSLVKNEPKHELDFILTTNQSECSSSQKKQLDERRTKKMQPQQRGRLFKKLSKLFGKNDKKDSVHHTTESGIACSLASREEISFEQLKSQMPTGEKVKAKPVIIICHGFMSWRNQMLLINLSTELLTSLNAYILRFDFTGNGHSKGVWTVGKYDREYEDLSRVIDFVTICLGCPVRCVIGHSKGTASVLNYASHVAKQALEEGKDVECKCFVNLAGRYRVPGMHDPLSKFKEEQRAELQDKGFFDIKSAWGDDRVFKVTIEDLSQEVPDTGKVIDNLRKDCSVRVMTIHGSDDEVVPVQDAFRFDEEIANHRLHVIETANHNFNGLKFIDEMKSQIVTFYNSVYNERDC